MKKLTEEEKAARGKTRNLTVPLNPAEYEAVKEICKMRGLSFTKWVKQFMIKEACDLRIWKIVPIGDEREAAVEFEAAPELDDG